MQYEVSVKDPEIIDIAPKNDVNEIFQAIRRYEPRVSIDNITFDGEISGKLIPKVVITI